METHPYQVMVNDIGLKARVSISFVRSEPPRVLGNLLDIMMKNILILNRINARAER